MPLAPPDRAFMKELYGNLADMALEPGSRFYEPVFEELELDDPVEQIATLIEFDGVESLRLFSGFRGSGKTTELFRLRQRLEQDGYFVLYADALNYVNPSEPIEITDLLMVLAGAFSDALEATLGADLKHESFWTRVRNFLDREVEITGGTAKLGFDPPAQAVLGGLKSGVDLKFELKSATSFRKSLQHFLANKLRELKANVDAFFEDGIKAIRAARGPDTRVVFIFDSLEQLRGTLQSEPDVIRSVQRIFATHLDLLKRPYVHMVFTVPPWLKFVLPNTAPITLLSTPHLWNNDTARSRCDPAWNAFRSLIARRLGEEGLGRLFGGAGERDPSVDAIIAASGGHFRDLLRLLRDTVVRATSARGLPVPAELITQVVNTARRDFLPIAQDDARWLAEIGRVRATALPSTESEPVNRLARFLDSHFVLYFVNADEWYDIHPLIRDEVASVLQASEPATG